MTRPYVWEIACDVRQAWRAISYTDEDLRKTLDRARHINELQDGCRLFGPMWTGRQVLEHLLGLLVPESAEQHRAVKAIWDKLNDHV